MSPSSSAPHVLRGAFYRCSPPAPLPSVILPVSQPPRLLVHPLPLPKLSLLLRFLLGLLAFCQRFSQRWFVGETRFSALGLFSTSGPAHRRGGTVFGAATRFASTWCTKTGDRNALAMHRLRCSATKPEGIARAGALKRSAAAHAKAPARTFRAGAFDMSANARKRQPTSCELSVTCAGASRCSSRRKWRRHR